jgi:hypothetical protein
LQARQDEAGQPKQDEPPADSQEQHSDRQRQRRVRRPGGPGAWIGRTHGLTNRTETVQNFLNFLRHDLK